MHFLPQLDPYAALEEIVKLNSHMVEAAKNLSAIKDSDVQIGTTEKTTVFQQDKVSLYHYKARTKNQLTTPVLVTYGLIGRYTMADLQEDRSLIRNMLDQGVDIYAIDWGSPSRADRWLRLEDYIKDYMHACIDFIKTKHAIDKINLLGICEGGVFSICYAALYPDSIKNLITSITPVDFHGDQRDDNIEHGYINLWTRNLKPEDIDMMVATYGNMPGELMGMVFQLLTPLKSLTKYNIDLLDIAQDEKKLLNFLRMEKWLSDRPDHPGEAAKQWFKDLYQDNKLIHNAFELDGETVNLKKITLPVLNIFARNDHIIPPECSMALEQCVGSKDYTNLSIPGGHVGVFVSGKSQGIIGQGIVDWLLERDG
ncbi:MAG: class III poly(R)-hydroxyalkanoic acid synthase subunit PhaC [Cellvibrionaceae bacterium]|nr:class III poly(R)-hydroxyalkanoic acid synthase subunit PhaC [Cellvibrionaceae bacterium]